MGVTTSSQYGRAQVSWPDYAHDGGTALHTKLTDNGVKPLSDNLISRYKSVVALADSASTSLTHNFNMALTELSVLLFESGILLRQDQVADDYVITQTSVNEISIQNASGGAKTFEIVVLGYSVAQLNGSIKGQVTTGDATPTALITVPVPTDTQRVALIKVIGTASSAYNAYMIRGVIKNVSGTVSFVEFGRDVDENNADWSVSIVGSGANAVVQVTGEAAMSIAWHGVIDLSLF